MQTILTDQLSFGNNWTGNYQTIISSPQFPSMNVKEVRKIKLQRLIDHRFGGVAARLAAALEMKPPQLNRWLTGGQGISEESARSMERKLSLAGGWMDRLPESLKDSPAVAGRIQPAQDPIIAQVVAILEKTDATGRAMALGAVITALNGYTPAKANPAN